MLYNLVEKTLYVCYVDLTKAFDYWNRDALIVKLQQRNVDGKILNAIKSMFHKTNSSVKWDGKISKAINNRYGVIHWGVLSPKLLNEFLQDLRKYLNSKYGLKIGDLYLAYLLFADDIVLFSELAKNLQAQIELFCKYCEIWNLIISIAKTKIVIYNQIYAKQRVKQQTTSVTIYGDTRRYLLFFKTTNSSVEILDSLDLLA